MNFNITNKPEYSLYARQTDELIRLYGINVILLLTEKINYDSTVFGDYSAIKTNSKDVFSVPMLPENADEFDHLDINFTEYGMRNTETINLFVSRKSIENIFNSISKNVEPIKELQNNLIILPNSRVMEITDIQFMVPGINNLFTNANTKNVYRLTLKTYEVKLSDDLSSLDVPNSETVGSYKELESYFDELTVQDKNVKTEAKNEINANTKKTVISPADDVFGRF